MKTTAPPACTKRSAKESHEAFAQHIRAKWPDHAKKTTQQIVALRDEELSGEWFHFVSGWNAAVIAFSKRK